MANEKEIIRGQVTLDLGPLDESLKLLPTKIENALKGVRNQIKTLGQGVAGDFADAATPVNQLVSTLEKVAEALDRVNAALKASGQDQVRTSQQTADQLTQVDAKRTAAEKQEQQKRQEQAVLSAKEQADLELKQRQQDLQRQTALDRAASQERRAQAQADARVTVANIQAAGEATVATTKATGAAQTAQIKADAQVQAATVRASGDAQVAQVRANGAAQVAATKAAADQQNAQTKADAAVQTANIKAAGSAQAAQIQANARIQASANKDATNQQIQDARTAATEKVNLQKAADQAQIGQDKLAAQTRLAEQKQDAAQRLAAQKQELAERLANEKLALQQVVAQERVYQIQAQTQLANTKARSVGGGGASTAEDEALATSTTGAMRALAQETSTANERLAEAEQRIFAVWRAGQQIAQVSFIFGAFGAAVAGLLGKTIQSAEGFDTWSRKAVAAAVASGGFGVSVQQVQRQLEDLSARIGSFSPEEVAQAYYYWQSATGEVIDSQQKLSQVLNQELLPVLQASAVAQTDVGTAIRGVSQALGEFGLGMNDAAHAAQVMLATSQLTNAEFTDLIESFKMFGPAASGMGISIEELSAVLGELAQKGLRGGQAGQGLSQVLLSLVDPSQKATKELDAIFSASGDVGKSWQEILFPGGQFVGLLDKIGQDGNPTAGLLHLLADRLREMSPAQQQAALAAIEQSRAFRALYPLVQDYIDNTSAATTGTQQLYEQLQRDPTKLFSQQIETYSAGIKEQFGRRINDLKASLIDLGLAAAQALLPLLDALTRVVDQFRALGEAHPQLVELLIQLGAVAVVAGTLASALGVVIGNVTNLFAALSVLKPAIVAIGAEMASMGVAVLPVLVAIVAGVALMAAAWQNNWAGIRDAIEGLQAQLGDFATFARRIFHDLVAALDGIVHFDWSKFSAGVRDAAINALAALLEFAAQVGPALVQLFKDALHDIDGVLTEWFGDAYVAGRTWAEHVTQGLRDSLLGEVRGILDQANSLIGGMGALTAGPHVAGRAYGGTVQTGEVTLVGERGPELVVLPPGSQVVPNHDSMGIIARGKAVGDNTPYGATLPGSQAAVTTAGSAAASAQTPDPGPLLKWAEAMGQKIGDAFIKGFGEADFSQLESLLDDVTKNLEAQLADGVFGKGAAGIDVFIAKYTEAINTLEQIIQLAKQGVTDIPAALTASLGNVAGALAPDILAVAQAYGQAQHDQGVVDQDKDRVATLEHEKALIDDRKAAEQSIIDSLNRQKEPYQDQLSAIDKVIEGLNRQKQLLEDSKNPLNDLKQGYQDIIANLQLMLQPLQDLQYALQQQKNALIPQKEALNDSLYNNSQVADQLKQRRESLDSEKVPVQDRVAGRNDEIAQLQYANAVNDQQKTPYEDDKKRLQELIDTRQSSLDDEKDKLQQIKDEQQAQIDAAKDALDAARQAEADRHQAVQDKIDGETAALDIIKEQYATELDAAQARVDAEQEALNATKQRFQVEESIAASRVKQAELLGASSNVTGFLKYQEAQLQAAHAGALAPAQNQLTADQAALKDKKAAQDADVKARERLIKGESDAEKARTTEASRRFALEERAIAARQKQNEADNKALEDQIKADESYIKRQQAAQKADDAAIARIDREDAANNKKIAALQLQNQADQLILNVIDAQERQLAHEEAANQQEREDLQRQLDKIARQEEMIDRQSQAASRAEAQIQREIDLENRKVQSVDRQIELISRQEELLNRQIQAEQEYKWGPQDQIDALDEQIKQHERINEQNDLDAKNKERELKSAQDQQKVDEATLTADQDRLKDAEALLQWHQKITEEIQKQQDALKKGSGSPSDNMPGGAPTSGRTTGNPHAPSRVENPQGDERIPTPGEARTSAATTLATAIWQEYARGARAALGQVDADLTDHVAAVGGHLGRVSVLAVAAWQKVGPSAVKAVGDIVTAIDDAIGGGYEEGGQKLFTRRKALVVGPDGEVEKWKQLWGVTIRDLVGSAYDTYTSTVGALFGKKNPVAEAITANQPGRLPIGELHGPELPLPPLHGPELPPMLGPEFPGELEHIAEEFGRIGAGAAEAGPKIADAFKIFEEGTALKNIFGLADAGKALLSIGEAAAGGSGPFGWPLLLLIDLVTSVVEHWQDFSKNMQAIGAFLIDLFDQKIMPVFKEFVAGTMDRLGPALTNVFKVLGFVDEVVKTLLVTIGAFLEKLGPVAGPIFKAFVDQLLILVSVIKNLWFILLDIIGGNWGKLGQDLKNLVMEPLKLLLDIFSQFGTALDRLVPTLLDALKNAGDHLGPALKALGDLIGSAVGGKFDELGTAIHDKVQKLSDDVRDLIYALPKRLYDALVDLVKWVGLAFEELKDHLYVHSIIPDMLDDIVQFFKDLPKRLYDALVDLVKEVSQPFKDAWDWFAKTFFGTQGLLKTFADGFADLGTGIVKALGALGSGAGLTELDDTTVLGKLLNPFIRIINWVDKTFFGKDGLPGKFEGGLGGLKTSIGNVIGVAKLAASGFDVEYDDGTVLGTLVNPFIRLIKWVRDTFFGKAGIEEKFKTGLGTLAGAIKKLITAPTDLKKLDDTNVLAPFVNPFIDAITWVETALFGKGDGNGLVGKFTTGLGTILTTVQTALGLNEDGGIRKLFKGFADTIQTVWGWVDKLINRLGEFKLPPLLQNLLEKFGILGGGGSPQGSPAPKPAQGGSSTGEGPIHDDWVYEQGPGGKFSHQNANAIDLAVPEGTAVYAVGDGVVQTGQDADYGNYIDLTTADGNTFRYGHLSQYVKTGKVGYGDEIALSGNTGYSSGPHLHFEHTGGPDMVFGDVYDWVTGGERVGPNAEGIPYHDTRINHNGQSPTATPEKPGPRPGVQSTANPGNRPGGQFGQLYDFVVDWVRGALGLPSRPGNSGANLPGGPGTSGGINTSGLPAAVAQWADKTRQTFGGLGSWVPAAMLAIIEHESGGDPHAYNAAGDAYGLFQQLHIGTFDPDTEFADAYELAQEKFSGIHNTYAANGLAPDVEGQARDLFLAWAGQFDYDTGQPNPFRDISSGNNAAEFLAEIMPMFDAIYSNYPVSNAGGYGLPGTPGSYATGLYDVPVDDLPAKLHKGEMVIPSTFANSIRQALQAPNPAADLAQQLKLALPQLVSAGGVLNLGGGTSTVEQHHHYHLHVDGVATATNPEDNRSMLQRLAWVNNGTFHGA